MKTTTHNLESAARTLTTAARGLRERADRIRERRHRKTVSKDLPIKDKWSKLVQKRSGQPFEEGNAVYDSFSGLVELRNTLVHRASEFRPVHGFPSEDVFPSEKRKGKRGKAEKTRKTLLDLRNEFEFSSPADGEGLPWTSLVLNAACARWSVNTAAAMVSEYWRRPAEVQPRDRVAIPWEPIRCLDGVGNVCTDGGPQVILASNCNQSCTKDSDCVSIASGDVCFPCLIECANGGAINADAMSQYQTDIEKTSAWATIQSSIYSHDAQYIPCGCPYNGSPCCQAGVCQIGTACFPPADAEAGVEEAGRDSAEGGD